MNIWRLVAHHDQSEAALAEFLARGVLAVGWTEIGDLNEQWALDAEGVTGLIAKAYPNLNNAHLGGPSLWNFHYRMKVGDQVIVTADRVRRAVFAVTGDYVYSSAPVLGYRHLRAAQLTSLDANDLWKRCGAQVADGQNVRWTVAACELTEAAESALLEEGRRYSIQSTVIERNPRARQECVAHHGFSCAVCSFNFSDRFGSIGEGYIHVHHRVELSSRDGAHVVDPIRDLVPLCPNCHAMAHQKSPPFSVEELRAMIIA